MEKGPLAKECISELGKILKQHGAMPSGKFTAINYLDKADANLSPESVTKRIAYAFRLMGRLPPLTLRKKPVTLQLYSKRNGKRVAGFRQSLRAVNLFNGQPVKGIQTQSISDLRTLFNKEFRFISRIEQPAKLISKVLAFYLNQFLEGSIDGASPSLSEYCFAYRKNKSHHDLLTRAEKWIFEEGYSYALRTDITSFFDRIRQDRMRLILEKALLDQNMADAFFVEWCMALAFPRKLASWEVKRRSKKRSTFSPCIKMCKSVGVPQGSPLSAPLSNLYLTGVDHDMASEGLENEFKYLRYADDIMVLCRNENIAQLASERLKHSIEDHGLALELNAGKTDFQDVRSGKVSFMGFQWTGNPTPGRRKIMIEQKYFNFRHKITEATTMRLRRSYLKKKQSPLSEEEYLLKRIITTINRKLLGQTENKTNSKKAYPMASHYNHGNEELILQQMRRLDRWIHYRVARFVVGDDEKRYGNGRRASATKYVFQKLLPRFNGSVAKGSYPDEQKLHLHHLPRLFIDRQRAGKVTVYGVGH